MSVKNGGITIVSPHDYDHFINALERMRLELSLLQRKLSDLIYNRDSLTGAINRVNMLPILREQQILVKRHVQLCCIAMIDLDFFKSINDQYGHAIGDQVLAEISQYVINNIRPYDKFFRVGGEEFLICFPNTNITTAFEIVDRLRVGIAQKSIHINADKTIHITVSFGITVIEPELSVEKSIDRADEALYKAKSDGRNSVRIWGKRNPN